MSIVRDQFPVEIHNFNKPFTPREVKKYISNLSDEQFADPDELSKLKKESLNRLEIIVQEHQLDMSQILQAEESLAGKKLAELANKCCYDFIRLIREGGEKGGVLI